jgi:HEAT repeat protein
MLKLIAIISILCALLLSNASCAYSRNASANAHAPAAEQAQGSKAQTSAFINVEGADLNGKLAEALRRARAASGAKRLFWSAYSFDVRSGVAIDPAAREFHGSINNIGDTTVFVGTSQGMTIETRNLGIFVLRDSTTGATERLEIYNLDKPREYAGYPVYWLGRGGNEESLAFLRPMVEATHGPAARQQTLLAEHAALAIAVHDDERVTALLKDFIRSSRQEGIRSISVFWLGQRGEEQFLADIVRNEREDADLRSHAAHAIGASRDKSALALLQSLYQTVANKDVRRSIIHGIAENEDRDAATAFLLKVARTDPDQESRQHAVHLLGEVDSEATVDELMKIFAADKSEDVRRAVLHALSEMQNARAQGKLMEIARTAQDEEMRAHAIHLVAERGGEAVIDELSKMYDAERSREVKQRILHAFSEMEGSSRAEEKLFAVARSDSDREMRQQAIHWIGERAGERSLALLRDTVNSNTDDQEVQMQALHAISERPADEAVPLLIKIARTHPNSEIRRAAMHWLGESGDPRAVEFFKEVLSKSK